MGRNGASKETPATLVCRPNAIGADCYHMVSGRTDAQKTQPSSPSSSGRTPTIVTPAGFSQTACS